MFGLCLFGSPILAPALRWLQRQNYTLNKCVLREGTGLNELDTYI